VGGTVPAHHHRDLRGQLSGTGRSAGVCFLFALLPALRFAVSLFAYLPVDTAVDTIVERMRPFLPNDVVKVISAEIEKLLTGNPESLLTFAIAGAIGSSSSGAMSAVIRLNRAYDIEEFRPWWKPRLIAVGLWVAVAVFAVVAFALIVGSSDLAGAVASGSGPVMCNSIDPNPNLPGPEPHECES
jgi:uncharacterized BrkB/YihY/UPF0761 family membrane protein